MKNLNSRRQIAQKANRKGLNGRPVSATNNHSVDFAPNWTCLGLPKNFKASSTKYEGFKHLILDLNRNYEDSSNFWMKRWTIPCFSLYFLKLFKAST